MNKENCALHLVNYSVFDMFRTSKCSSSGRLVHPGLSCFRRSSLVDGRMCLILILLTKIGPLGTSCHLPDCLYGGM